jgi:glycosyltransferase involved in cell wall biosynthesis
MNAPCSIIIPTLNRRDRLLRTLRVVRAQHHDDLEIIVSDDGSTDGTADAVAGLGDDRIRVIEHDRWSGVANARNRGIAAATGRYVAFLDDDDLWVPQKLSAQIEEMAETGRRWVYCNSVLVDDELRYLGRDRGRPHSAFEQLILMGNQVPGGCSSVVAERSLLDQVGWFDPELSMFADWDLWIRLTEAGPPAKWPAAGVLYVVHPEQMSMDTTKSGGELQSVRSKHRAAMVERGAWDPDYPYDPLDSWILRQLWLSGRWFGAVRYMTRDPSLATLKGDLKETVKLALERRAARHQANLLPDESEALTQVRALVGDRVTSGR